MLEETLDDLESKRVCIDCIKEPFLRAITEKARDEATCSYCNQVGATLEIGDLAERVEGAFEKHFTRTASEPSSLEYAMLKDKESNYEWEREGEPVVYAIMNAAEIPEEAAQDIQNILEHKNGTYDDGDMGRESAFDSESHYREKPATGADWHHEWDHVENSLRTEARFFSSDAEKMLSSIFAGIESLQTATSKPIIVQAGPETTNNKLFRARVFQSDEKLKTALENLDLELAPPPSVLATAGRMNARGISVFYGATNASTALAEIRPPVGSSVVVAHFDIVRPVHLLDLAALGEIGVAGSIFDSAYSTQLERAAFLSTLGQRITRPVMPDDEALDYLVTQAIADYLATRSSHPVDGIIYRSAQNQNDGRNVVLFHKAARVERFDRPLGTEIHTSLGHWDEDGWEASFEVIESVPPKDPPKKEGESLEAVIHRLSSDFSELYADGRDATLRLDIESVEVHEIQAVTFQTESHRVRHFRWEQKDDTPF